MMFDEIKTAALALPAEQQSELVGVLLGGSGGTAQPQSGGTPVKPPVAPVKQP